MAGLSNGGNSALKRRMPMPPAGSCTSVFKVPPWRSSGSRSMVGFCHQSTSPAVRALAAVAGSGTTCHSMRSYHGRLGPAVNVASPSARGT
jgi:hypothetical protein